VPVGSVDAARVPAVHSCCCVPDVAADLKLTDDQKSKAQALAESQRQGGREFFQALQNASPEERAKKMQERQAEQDKATNAILTAEQQKRFAQVRLQVEGYSAVVRPEIGQQLKITDDQRQKIQGIQEGRMAAMRELVQAGGGGDREALQKKMQEMQKSSDEKIAALLTDDQKKQWKSMTGEPLKTAA